MKTNHLKLGQGVLRLSATIITSILIVSTYVTSGQSASAAPGNVRLLQRDLAGLSYMPMSGVDGTYGPNTSASVRQFQSDNGLTIDGIVGPQTMSALTNKVKQVERAVQTTVDGDYGQKTITAVKRYQQAHQLEVDGIAGPQTMQNMKIVRKVNSKTTFPSVPSRMTTKAPYAHGKLAYIVAIARAIESGHAEQHWKGGHIPYSWALSLTLFGKSKGCIKR